MYPPTVREHAYQTVGREPTHGAGVGFTSLEIKVSFYEKVGPGEGRRIEDEQSSRQIDGADQHKRGAHQRQPPDHAGGGERISRPNREHGRDPKGDQGRHPASPLVGARHRLAEAARPLLLLGQRQRDWIRTKELKLALPTTAV